MTEYRKGDLVAVHGVVTSVPNDEVNTVDVSFDGNPAPDMGFHPDDPALHLLRRAPVDLATCDLSEPVAVLCPDGRKGWLRARNGNMGFVTSAGLEWAQYHLDTLRPADAPAPAAGKYKVPEGQTPLDDNLSHRLIEVFSEGVKSRDTGASSPYHGQSLEHCLHASGWVQRDLRLALDKAMDAPTCPPGHIMIGGRAVPQPMREEPRKGQPYWRVCADQSPLAMRWEWDGRSGEVMWLARGLIHSTEAAARTHAEAIIALSAGEGVA